MTVRSKLVRLLRAGIERGVRPYGYRLIKPANRYGIDLVADVRRLARLWDVDFALAFDVGANVGARALDFRAAWPACAVVAFEPNGAVAERLRANVAAVGGVRVEERALGDRTGRADFFLYEDASDLSSLNAATPYTERFGLAGRAVGVAVTTLDDYCSEHAIGHINLLKIDAEGSDHDILRGAGRMIAGRHIDFITCEFNSLAPEAGASGSLLPIAALLGGHGYDFVASYNDYIVTEGRFFAVSNALFAAGRSHP